MDTKKEAFRKRLLATFRVEALEHIHAMSSGLVGLENSSAADSHPQTLETVFREAHSLKGAARAVNAETIETICQSLESVFSSWQRGETVPNAALFDVLHQATDSLERAVLSIPNELNESPIGQLDPTSLIVSLDNALHGAAPATSAEPGATRQKEPPAPQAKSGHLPSEERIAPVDTIRIPAARLGSLLLEAEELLNAKLAACQLLAEAEDLRASLAPWKKTRAQVRLLLRSLSARPAGDSHQASSPNGNGNDSARARKLIELEEQDDSQFHSLEDRLEELVKTSQRDSRSLERMVDQLLDSARQVVMLPAAFLLETFPRLARDLARDRGKLVDLEVQGADLDMDRRILEEMKEPLLHLLRNAIDHGIEPPADRRKAGKPEQGRLLIALRRKDSDKAELLVSDDGRGIEFAGVRAAVLKLGILSQDESQTMETQDDPKAIELIFRSGVSTSPIITDLSGRGLGLAIVRERVEKLGGLISIETKPGVGTTFRMLLPFTRAAFRGVVVREDQHLFVLPSVQVERVLRFREKEVKTVENRETLSLDGRPTALVRLEHALALPPRQQSSESATGQAVLIGSAGSRIAIRVDEVLDEQEVLAKPLGKQLAGLSSVAGATVLASGRVVPILDVAHLLSAAANAAVTARSNASSVSEQQQSRKSILVAEDSITARALLKNILETAGYQVQTAVDGAEAFATLKTANFDVLISDVDMPRLNGFGLTAKVRNDPKLAALPVILVTALGSREDRERGIDAGANAYIVKSNFDESNLLEVLRRLL